MPPIRMPFLLLVVQHLFPLKVVLAELEAFELFCGGFEALLPCRDDN